MSPVLIGGRELGVQTNGVFSALNTDPIPGGRLWNGYGSKDAGAAAAWNAARTAFISDGGNPADFAPAGAISSSRTRGAQDHTWYVYMHGGPAAAVRYTSNHGWGLAVDIISHVAAAWLLIHGAKFGISHDEGERVGEWWHFRYVGGFKPKKRDGLAHLTRVERRRVRELDKLRRTGQKPDRQRTLVHALTDQRKAIWHAAEDEPHGWDHQNRLKRYRSLLARTS